MLAHDPCFPVFAVIEQRVTTDPELEKV